MTAITNPHLSMSSTSMETASILISQASGFLQKAASEYPFTKHVTDAVGACFVFGAKLNDTYQNGATFDKDRAAQELGELEKCAKFFEGIMSAPAPEYSKHLKRLIADIASVADIDPVLITSYSETNNIKQGERTELFNQFSAAANNNASANNNAKKFFEDLPEKFSPETSRGEKLVTRIYSNCGRIQAICDGLKQNFLIWCPAVEDEARQTFQAIGNLLGMLSDPFVEEYFSDMSYAEYKALAEKLANPATYDQMTSGLVIQFNQEIVPLRVILARHTGEEAAKQDSVINNYDHMIDIHKRDLDGMKSNQHPMAWITGILIAVRMSLLTGDTWTATWTGMLSLLLFAVPFAILWRRDFESFAGEMTIEYPNEADFWVTRTHLNDQISKTRGDIILKFGEKLDKRRKDRKRAEWAWFMSVPVVAAANVFSSVCGWA